MVRVDAARCAYCGGCVSVCPEDAIRLEETQLTIGPSCTDCGLCVAACPVGALHPAQEAGPLRTEVRIGDRYDVVVIGAGPGGSTAARQAAELGLSVLMLEKRQEIGSPVRCAEGLAHDALADFLEPDPAWISARVSSLQITTMAQREVVQHWRGKGGLGYVLERRVFDRALAEEAIRAGACVLVKAAATGLVRDRGGVRGAIVEWQGEKTEIEAGVVIAADGIESRAGAWAGLDTRLPASDAMVCAQYLLAGIDWDPECLGFWIGEEIAPGGYAWVFPKGEGRANVGLGVQSDMAAETALSYLQRFVDRLPALAVGSPVTLVAGSVPAALPCRPLATSGLMLVGDAARLADPLTGGGIANAMVAGRLAGIRAAEALSQGDTSSQSLLRYQDDIDQVMGRTLARSYRLRRQFPPNRRLGRDFVRLFAVAAGGK